ncbi:MAG: hypothetical protein R3C54_00095 [Parvularculaceae bacterium]
MSSDANAPDRTIGLFGAVITLVGFVVGASIYILPGAIAASAGPGVVISYGIACLLALFSCIVAAQIGVAYPASGASFVIIGRLVSPFIGFLLVWMMIGAAAVAIALLGYGFADYVGVWISGGHRSLIGGGVIILFTIVNLLGARERYRRSPPWFSLSPSHCYFSPARDFSTLLRKISRHSCLTGWPRL